MLNTSRAKVIKDNVKTYAITKKLLVLVADYEGTGDVIDLLLNNEIIDGIVLTDSYQVFEMDMKPGYNSIFFRAVQ